MNLAAEIQALRDYVRDHRRELMRRVLDEERDGYNTWSPSDLTEEQRRDDRLRQPLPVLPAWTAC